MADVVTLKIGNTSFDFDFGLYPGLPTNEKR